MLLTFSFFRFNDAFIMLCSSHSIVSCKKFIISFSAAGISCKFTVNILNPPDSSHCQHYIGLFSVALHLINCVSKISLRYFYCVVC